MIISGCPQFPDGTKEPGDISAKLNHISPRSWHGDTAVKNIIFLTCLSEGQWIAESQLSYVGWQAPFNKMEKPRECDIFCPFGNKRMVLMDGLTDGEQDEDNDEVDAHPPSDELSQLVSAGVDLSEEPNLEDLATKELSCLDTSCLKHEAYLIIDGDTSSTSKHKSSILQVFSHSDVNLTDHLKHRWDLPHFNESGKGLGFRNIFDPQEPKINICRGSRSNPHLIKNFIWLVVVQVVDIWLDYISLQSLPTCLLVLANVWIKVQVLHLAPVKLGEEMVMVIGSGLAVSNTWQAQTLHAKLTAIGYSCSIQQHHLPHNRITSI
jgi:hypothetical protein